MKKHNSANKQRKLVLTPVYVIHANGYDSGVAILRGTASILASITGLLLVYGIIFELEGMPVSRSYWQAALHRPEMKD